MNGQSLGYGYVQFKTKEMAENCIKLANGKKFRDRDVTVEKF